MDNYKQTKNIFALLHVNTDALLTEQCNVLQRNAMQKQFNRMQNMKLERCNDIQWDGSWGNDNQMLM